MLHRHDVDRTIRSVSFAHGANTFAGIAGSFADRTVWSPTWRGTDVRVMSRSGDGLGTARGRRR